MKHLKNKWYEDFKILVNESKQIRIISPFISGNVVDDLIKLKAEKDIFILTRASIKDFSEGVSDVNQLKRLIENNVQIKVVKRKLHSKIYIFDESKFICTSSNFSDSGLDKNFEYGLLIEDKKNTKEALSYFHNFWNGIQELVEKESLDKWKKEADKNITAISKYKSKLSYNDYGNDVNDINNADSKNKRGGKLYLVYFEESKHRKWKDAYKYGFVSAGFGEKFKKEMKKLKKGNRILVKLLEKKNHKKNIGRGFIAYGIVEEEAKMAKDVMIGNHNLITFCSYMEKESKNPNKSEWIVKVNFVTKKLSEGVIEEGLYYRRGKTVSEINLKDPIAIKTIKRLKELDFIKID